MSRMRGSRDTRETQRPALAADRKSRLYVPQHLIPENKVWRWFAESVYNAPNDGRIEDALMSGWKAVDGTQYAGLRAPPLPGREETAKDTLVRKGGQILMEIDRDLYEQKVDDHEAESRAAMNAISTAVDGPGMQDDDRLQVHGAQTKFEHRRPIKQ